MKRGEGSMFAALMLFTPLISTSRKHRRPEAKMPCTDFLLEKNNREIEIQSLTPKKKPTTTKTAPPNNERKGTCFVLFHNKLGSSY